MNVPVFINSRDRLTSLRRLITWLEGSGVTEIWVIDNASTYPPLLDYLESLPHRVIRLDRNLGHRAPWLSGVVQREAYGRFHVATDPDVIPSHECPADALNHFQSILEQHPEVHKVGFGLRIDDLPDHNPLKPSIIGWESRFWANEIAPGVHRANIDTTFALYRPMERRPGEDRSLRTGFPYVAHHLPWYSNPSALSDEDRYYRAHADPAFSNWDRDKLPRWKQRRLTEHAGS